MLNIQALPNPTNVSAPQDPSLSSLAEALPRNLWLRRIDINRALIVQLDAAALRAVEVAADGVALGAGFGDAGDDRVVG